MAWQAQEIGVLIHFNMGTYVENHDGCTGDVVPPISLFDPKDLNTNNWIQTIVDLGARYAVLVAKVIHWLNMISINIVLVYNLSF